MPLHASRSSRERILDFGGAGTGKTTDWLTIADYSRKTGSDAKFYAIDTDYTVERSLEGYPELVDSGLLKVEICDDWTEWDKLTDRERGTFLKGVRPHDWVIVDMAGVLWDYCQDYYIDKVFKKDADDMWLEFRASKAKGNPLDGYKDWGVINKIYRAGFTTRMMRLPCNLFCVTSASAVSSDTDSKEIKALYARAGVKPKGQKELSHLFHTIIWKQNPTPTRWVMQPIKDRERPWETKDTKDFVMSYLVPIAKWKLGSA